MVEQPSHAGKSFVFAGISLILICFDLLRDFMLAAYPAWAAAFAALPAGQPVVAFLLLLVLAVHAAEDYPALAVWADICSGLVYLTFAAGVLAYLGGWNLFAAIGAADQGEIPAGAPSFAGMIAAIALIRLRGHQDHHTPFHMVRVAVVLFLVAYSVMLRVIPWPTTVEGVAQRGMPVFTAGLVLCVLAVRVPVLSRLALARSYGVEVALAATFVLSLYWLAGGLALQGTLEKLLTLGWFVLNSFALWQLGLMIGQNRRLLAVKERQIAELNEKRQKLRVLTNSLSHDLRSPIRNARTLHQYREELRATGEGSLGDVDARLGQNLDRAMALSETFVRYLTLGDAPVHSEPLEVRAMVGVIAARFAGRVSVVMGDFAPERIKAERDGFERVLENLIENAIRHNPERPLLEVRLEGETDAAGRYLLQVCDNGVGIPEEFQERVFQPFETLHPKSQTGSSGLGLAICHDLMARVGGTITLRNSATGGACFELSFATSKEGAYVGSSQNPCA